MANKIVFDYERMRSVSGIIASSEQEYRAAGNEFINEINEAIASWEGESKDKFQQLINSSQKLLTQDVPDAVLALKTILDNNAQSMQNADAEIANNIPASI